MATIYDVAAAADVSPATVSRVFNGGRVTAERAARVRRAAEGLGFAPNGVARSLRLRRSNAIALIIPDIENPYFTAVARGIEDRAQRDGLSVVLCNTDEDVAKERRYFDVVLSERMAGVVVAPASRRGTDLAMLLERDMPVVTVDRCVPGAAVDSATVDDRNGGAEAARHLLTQGYRRPACIAGPRTASTSNDRLAGFLSAVERGPAFTGGSGGGATRDGAAYRERYVRHADFRVDGGQAAMAELLAQPEPPDAVFVANNLMTLGALAELRTAGLDVPAFGVVSFGDLPPGAWLGPELTTVEVSPRELGRLAASQLHYRIEGGDGPPRAERLGTALRPRSSTALKPQP